jgi:hypothetical protein
MFNLKAVTVLEMLLFNESLKPNSFNTLSSGVLCGFSLDEEEV